MTEKKELTEENLKEIKDYQFWTKFYAILLFIGSGFLYLITLLFTITVVGILVAIPLGILATIVLFQGLYLFRSTKELEEINSKSKKDEISEAIVNTLDQFKSFAKLGSIAAITIFTVIVLVFIIVVSVAIISS